MSEWIKWSGGENPAKDKMVLVRFRTSNIQESYSAKANNLRWSHKMWPGDIVEYMIVGDVQ